MFVTLIKKGKRYSFFLLFIILFFITSCGFHLREPIQLAPSLQNIFIQTSDPYGQLTHHLQQTLKASNIQVSASSKNATAVLDILKEDTNQELLSVGGTQLTRQYKLILTVTFQITDPNGKILVPPTTLSETSTLPIQSNQILGGSNEANNLFAQMRQAIVYNILNRLASPEVTSLVSTPS